MHATNPILLQAFKIEEVSSGALVRADTISEPQHPMEGDGCSASVLNPQRPLGIGGMVPADALMLRCGGEQPHCTRVLEDQRAPSPYP